MTKNQQLILSPRLFSVRVLSLGQMKRQLNLCFLEHYFTDDPCQHDLFSFGQLLGGLSGWSLEAVGDDRHNHEDVAEAKQDPDDQS